ncbi:antirestriction protein ArdA [Asticcacaulis sp. W401b]|uniref:antirestriction protein ArdA n=1 Tax=Asticcacaulis sp. W401b TaxID=3388666 RepID=UPI003970D2E5
MTTLFAQPYDISARGFYFDTASEYSAKAVKLKNDYGQAVEEFEIQFIDGEYLDAKLFEALGVNQANHESFLEAATDWNDDEKIKVIIAVGEVGYKFKLGDDMPDQFEVELYQADSLADLAAQFVEEGLYGEIPEPLRNYIDYDAIARDLSVEYGETQLDGARYIYRCG